jgi:DNA-binding beta-propeller fold protein YncE
VTFRRVGTVAVPPGARPGFDHADVYLSGQQSRMYVAHTGADRIDVFDCARREYLRHLLGHPGVAGVLIDSRLDLLLATDRAAARLSVYRVSDERLLAQVAVGQQPNGIALDTGQMRAFTFDLGDPPGVGCTMTVVDLARHVVNAHVALPGRPRWAMYDAGSHLIYANIREPAVIIAIDSATDQIVRSVTVPAVGPHGLAIVDDLLFCAADGGELVVVETSGAIRAHLPLLGAPDVLMYDQELARVYVAIGSPGVVQSFDTRTLQPLETTRTEEGAHTIGWDPQRKELWAFAPKTSAALVFAETPQPS